jgi:hypothetical protein
MALYYGKHKVRDYEQWRPYFDGDQERIGRVGAKCLNVMRSTDDPNEVHFIFDLPDVHAFVGELQGPEVAELFQRAGVLEPPKIYRLQDVSAELQQGAATMLTEEA